MLSAIASLVHIRTILHQFLYSQEKFTDFRDLLQKFSTVELRDVTSSSETAMWHLNIIANFDALVDIFEKQTRSPGIKPCYDLRDIFNFGIFVLRTFAHSDNILTVELSIPRTRGAVGSNIMKKLQKLLKQWNIYLIYVQNYFD
jgi:hypothetical protein